MTGEEQVKRIARENGASIVAITNVAPFDEWQREVNEDMQASLLPAACIGKLRGDPADFLPGAKSIIVFGVAYEGLSDPYDTKSPALGGGIRRRPLCRQVAESIDEYLRAQDGRTVCNPDIPLKRAAERAGLGWLGKNGLFTSPRLGSGVRLGAVVTDLALAPDLPMEQEGCRQCKRCIEQCPGGALSEDGRFDANRCLCFLTEYDVPLPVGVRELLGNHLNCEECQKACPHNKGLPNLAWPGPDMLEMAMQAASDFTQVNDWFAERFEFRFTSRELMLRTLAVNLANAGRTDAIPLLERLTTETHPVLADCAQWALEKLQNT